MHKNLAPMPNPNMADYVRDCALPALKENSKMNLKQKKENGA